MLRIWKLDGIERVISFLGRHGDENAMITRAVLLVFVLLGTHATAAQQLGVHIPTLESAWHQQNGLCRGSTGPAMEKACALREKLEARLEALGMCYGVFSFGYNSVWETCDVAVGQRISVVRRGEVDLTTYTCRKVNRSSFIFRVCHDDAKRIMIVGVRDRYYAYCGIERMAVDQFFAASSMGRHFNQEFRGRKEC